MLNRKARRSTRAGLAVAALATTLIATPLQAASAAPAFAWMNTRLNADERASLVLAQMTLDQKTDLLIQTGGPGVPELGIPAIRGRDASNGLTTAGVPTTALPDGLALASSFNDELARQYGAVAGAETRATGYNSAAAPTIDLARSPWNGRQWEGTGEDPLLSGRLGSAQVQGIQSQQVQAEVKHYNVYNQETRRGHVDSQLDERTFQEVYTRPWEKVVTESDPASVMCSFNRINTVYGCSSGTLLNDVLKGQLGFKGYVSTDFNAAHSFADYAAGLDTSGETLEFSGDNLQRAVLDGRVSAQRVDDAARRVLRAMFATGVIDNPPAGSLTNPQPASKPIAAAVLAKNDQVATTSGQQGTVLLKNERSQLPLSTSTARSIAVIGSDADHYITGGGSAAVREPAQLTTVLDGITARAGSGVSVKHAKGTDAVSNADTLPGPAPVPSSVLSGVTGQYRLGAGNFSSPAFISRPEAQINLRTGLANDVINTSQVPGLGFPLVTTPMTGRWTGTLTAPAAGTYGLSISHLGSAKLYLDDKLVIDDAGRTYGTQSTNLTLSAGQKVQVRIDYSTDAPGQFDGSLNDQPGAMLRFGWTPPAGTLSPAIQEAVELAKKSDVAVVVARDYSGEAADRGDLSLPQDQDRLIAAVAAANPRTVVVLATSGAVTMPWLDKVPAVIEAWYGGQQQGKTLASVLFGDVNPSGKLPVTFPADEQQPVAIGVRNTFSDVATLNPVTAYTDGIDIGYRGYAKKNLTPLFPFGHGLSYTTFGYDKVQTKDFKTKDPSKPAQVKLHLTNTGKTSGTEVVQVYVGKLPTGVDTPAKALAGYARVSLEPGKKKNVTIDLDTRSLQYWDAATDSWVTPKGKVPVYVGTSASDIRLTGVLDVM
ncbi:glycoside hydrolase family 3 C-terminal domain-containing protein [Kineococcus sp. SYSU DK005]|uniref:glycoside hydrolase family 3 C-terminal domain-containing protein n=1 Tax=Kineococcus sp. SYSU DK005 TaxID=3383126 RepID=UPI003D7D14D6